MRGITIHDIAEMPGFNPKVANGSRSISEGKVFWTDTVWCATHGACLCVSENRAIWRCPACNEGAYVRWHEANSVMERGEATDG